ncbi:MAG TPA: LuxR C-terminal-related transcriptional regulator [Anaerolineales bacterium]|nr:LuxR C-terminal-related transcriptional regulator [Anaerolineales bacterium]
MSVLRKIIEYILGIVQGSGESESRVYLRDEELITAIKDVAKQQSRREEEVIADFTKAGLNQFLSQNEMENRWAALTHREQQVVALICLGYRNHEIAQTLVIAPETVKTHLQRIFDKFNLRSRKELRLALKDWEFREWWEHNRHE